MRRLILFLAMILSTAGCGLDRSGSSPPPSLVIRVDTVGGIPRVLSSGVPDTWSLDEVLRLGSSATIGEPLPDEFGRVTSAVFGPEGRIYVADGLNAEVRVFDRDGTPAFAFGRRGEGPGEFGALYSLAWVGDTLLALDFGVGRVGMFSPGGEWLGQHRHPGRISGSGRQLRLYQTSPHEAYAFSLEMRGNELADVFIRYTAAGPIDTLPMIHMSRPTESMVVCHHPDGSIHFWEIPFAPKLVQHPLRDGLRAVAETDRYRIAVVDEGGDTIRVLERAQDPVETTEEGWEEGLQEYRAFRDENPEASCEPRSPSRPDFVPPIVDLLADPDGSLWVQARTPEGAFWEVFGPDGALRGRVPDFPRGERTVPYFGEGRILNIVPDSLGVETVRVYELRIAGRAGVGMRPVPRSLPRPGPVPGGPDRLRRLPTPSRTRSGGILAEASLL